MVCPLVVLPPLAPCPLVLQLLTFHLRSLCCHLLQSPDSLQTLVSGSVPEGWTQNVCEGDQGWIGRSVFSAKGKLSPNLKVWWHPPSYQLPSVKPSPEVYFHRRLLLWMPRRMWKVDFHCPRCIPTQSLRSKGVYNHVRLVLDTQNYYYHGL